MDLTKHIEAGKAALEELSKIENPTLLQQQARIRATTYVRALAQCAAEETAEKAAQADLEKQAQEVAAGLVKAAPTPTPTRSRATTGDVLPK